MSDRLQAKLETAEVAITEVLQQLVIDLGHAGYSDKVEKVLEPISLDGDVFKVPLPVGNIEIDIRNIVGVIFDDEDFISMTHSTQIDIYKLYRKMPVKS